jgi:multidrug efflux pump subunit AcrA (membrane-fusion protein)
VERRSVVEERVVLTGEIPAVLALKIVVPRTESWQVAIKWLTEDGAEVKAGDPIVELDNSSLATAIEGKRLGVQEAQIALETREHGLSAQRQKTQLEVGRARLEVDKAQLDAAVPQELRSRREWNEMQSTL